jgi:hypothetical protein
MKTKRDIPIFTIRARKRIEMQQKEQQYQIVQLKKARHKFFEHVSVSFSRNSLTDSELQFY